MISLEMEEELLRCMKCGECQAVCPTFSVTGREGEVARGKMRVVRAIHRGELNVSRGVVKKLSTCLLCKACCTACPSGVRVDRIITAARKELADKGGIPLVKRAVLWGLEHPRVFSTVIAGAKAMRIFPQKRTIHVPSSDYNLTGEKGRVVFYAGCMINNLTPEIGKAVETVLREAGYKVERIKENCCGVPAYYAGLHERARRLAEKNLRNIKIKNRVVVTACPTCALGLREYPEFFSGELKGKALELARNTFEFVEFIAASGKPIGELESLNINVTFHDPCHALHGLGLAGEYRSLIRSIPGISLVEMEQGCCGFGGLFSFEHPGFSQTINEGRIKDILATKAQAAVTSCPGCKYYLQKGLRRDRKNTEVMHIAELLSRGI